MFITEFNGIQYVFDQDRLYLNGFPLLYSDISNIAHRGGAQPAFIFDYKGRRVMLPYNPSEIRSILPYFALARNTTTVAAPAPAPVEAAPAPEPYYQEMVPDEYEQKRRCRQ